MLAPQLFAECQRVDVATTAEEPVPEPDPNPNPDPDPGPTDPPDPPPNEGTIILGPTNDLSLMTVQARGDRNCKTIQKGGRDCIKFYLDKTELPPTQWGGRYRAEVRPIPNEPWTRKVDYAIEYEVFAPSFNPPASYTFMHAQFHGAPDDGENNRNAALACHTDGQGLFRSFCNYDPQKRQIAPSDGNGLRQGEVGVGNFGVDRWAKIRIECRLDWDGGGHWRFFIDGVQQGEFLGITGWRDDKPEYFKVGLYTFTRTAS